MSRPRHTSTFVFAFVYFSYILFIFIVYPHSFILFNRRWVISLFPSMMDLHHWHRIYQCILLGITTLQLLVREMAARESSPASRPSSAPSSWNQMAHSALTAPLASSLMGMLSFVLFHQMKPCCAQCTSSRFVLCLLMDIPIRSSRWIIQWCILHRMDWILE